MPEIEAERMVSVTMTAGAARQFWRALIWASAQADEKGHDQNYEWLSWGASRVSMAQRVEEDGPNG